MLVPSEIPNPDLVSVDKKKDTKKPIVLSNLAMRFYEHSGWTRAELESCLESGELKYWADDLWPYFVLVPYSRFDIAKLRPLVSESKTTFDDQPTDIDEVIRKYNW